MIGLNKTKGIAIFLAILVAPLASMIHAQTLRLPENGADSVVLHVRDGNAAPEMLKVFTAGASTPIAGRYVVSDTSLSFKPSFGFEPGQNYIARFVESGDLKEVAFSLSRASFVSAAVTAIYPSGDVLPENTLRFYLHFSVPMQPQVAFDFIRLVDASGNSDQAAFMRFKQELWNEDRTRLTVLIDPGRIKREVATNVELGPALLSGHSYSLVVDGGWPSADGASVLTGFKKTFHVADALRTRPNTNLWTLNLPCVGTLAPLTIELDRPFDRHSLPRSLRIEAVGGAAIEGRIDIENHERFVRFTPNFTWFDNNLRLIVSSALEDVASNNFVDLLDHVAGSKDGAASAMQRNFRLSHCVD